jgi:hypothetical protein
VVKVLENTLGGNVNRHQKVAAISIDRQSLVARCLESLKGLSPVTFKRGIQVRVVLEDEDWGHLREKIALTSDYCAIQSFGVDLEEFALRERRMILQDFRKDAESFQYQRTFGCLLRAARYPNAALMSRSSALTRCAQMSARD